MTKFLQERCEVCGDPVLTDNSIPEEMRDKIYRPSEGEVYDFQEEIPNPKGFGGEEE